MKKSSTQPNFLSVGIMPLVVKFNISTFVVHNIPTNLQKGINIQIVC